MSQKTQTWEIIGVNLHSANATLRLIAVVGEATMEEAGEILGAFAKMPRPFFTNPEGTLVTDVMEGDTLLILPKTGK